MQINLPDEEIVAWKGRRFRRLFLSRRLRAEIDIAIDELERRDWRSALNSWTSIGWTPLPESRWERFKRRLGIIDREAEAARAERWDKMRNVEPAFTPNMDEHVILVGETATESQSLSDAL